MTDETLKTGFNGKAKTTLTRWVRPSKLVHGAHQRCWKAGNSHFNNGLRDRLGLPHGDAVQQVP